MGLRALDHIACTYEPVWGAQRRIVAVRLRVRVLEEAADVPRLLLALEDWWYAGSPILIVAFQHERHLRQALAATAPDYLWLELPPAAALPSSDWAHPVSLARRHGHRLVQRVPSGVTRRGLPQPSTEWRYLFDMATPASSAAEPIEDDDMGPQALCAGLTTLASAREWLDHRRGWGVVGWPAADVWAQRRPAQRGPDKATLLRVQQALMHDTPLERVVALIHSDVALTYRLLRLLHSDAVAASRPMPTIREAIRALGERRFRDLLLRLMPAAVADADLLPLRSALVLRAQCMQWLMDAGPQQSLATEIYLTGVFSRLTDWWPGSMASLLAPLPLSDAMVEALVNGQGPYAPYLHIARLLEDPAALDTLPDACAEAGFSLQAVNTALLRTLARAAA